MLSESDESKMSSILVHDCKTSVGRDTEHKRSFLTDIGKQTQGRAGSLAGTIFHVRCARTSSVYPFDMHVGRHPCTSLQMDLTKGNVFHADRAKGICIKAHSAPDHYLSTLLGNVRTLDLSHLVFLLGNGFTWCHPAIKRCQKKKKGWCRAVCGHKYVVQKCWIVSGEYIYVTS